MYQIRHWVEHRLSGIKTCKDAQVRERQQTYDGGYIGNDTEALNEKLQELQSLQSSEQPLCGLVLVRGEGLESGMLEFLLEVCSSGRGGEEIVGGGWGGAGKRKKTSLNGSPSWGNNPHECDSKPGKTDT